MTADRGVIRPPRPDELERLQAIERSAGRAFLDVGLPEIAADEPLPVAVLERYRASGWAWIVTVGDGAPAPPSGGNPARQGTRSPGAGRRPGGRPETGPDGVVAAYVIVDVLDRPGPGDGPGRSAHIEQVSVDPAFAGRRLGARLIDHVADEARRRGLDAVTLTTFRHVPWNAPYYERCGFRSLADDELGPGLRRVRAREEVHGLDPVGRVCMRREL